MPSRLKAPPSPGFLTGNTLPQTTGADARYETSQDTSCETQPSSMPPEPPPGGWTLAEAAQALLPDLYAAASKASPNARQAGPGEPNRTERDALRRAFARIMETGEYVAEGIREQKLETISPEIWRAATQVAFGLPREPLSKHLPGVELCVDHACWAGVRLKHKVAAPAVLSRHPEPEVSKRRGGRPPTYDWKPFKWEVSRRLALDGGHMTLTAFRRYMKEWVAQNMPEPAPDDRTIARQLDELVPPDVFAPD